MNLDTMRAVLRAELHQNSPYIDGAIADALRFVRKEPVRFNGAKHTISLMAGKEAYQLPNDFIGMNGSLFITPANTSDVYKYEMQSVPVDQIESMLYASFTGNTDLSDVGVARVYAIDYITDGSARLLIAPRPSTGGESITFRYIRDLGTPQYTATTTLSDPPSLQTVFTLKDPDGSTLSGTYTNPWFVEGFELIRSRAMYTLLSRYHGGTDGASIGAQNAQVQYLEELNRLRGEAAMAASNLKVRKWI